MRVKNHKDFACFNYPSTAEKTAYQLGDIVIRYPQNNPFDSSEFPEIGIVLQLHDQFELRTDMFGNCCIDEIRIATPCEIIRWRNDILK